MNLGELLKMARKRCGYTQEWVAKQIGEPTHTNYNAVERGKRRISSEKLAMIAKIYGLDNEPLQKVLEVWDSQEASDSLIRKYFADFTDGPSHELNLSDPEACLIQLRERMGAAALQALVDNVISKHGKRGA